MTTSAFTGPWWQTAVFYQVYPSSFADGDDDGIGDLVGLRNRLDYLQQLGLDALWLSPFYRSPMADGGYDVADPCDVDPRFGTLADFDAMLSAAHARGIRVTIDIVPNHFSNQHPWFREALAAGPSSPQRRRFIFRGGRGEHGELPPNNWPSAFGGPAWTRVDDGEWYLHLFAPEQPDLNWADPAVPAEFARIMRFWLDRGVDGFRVDVAHGMAKPADLPDLDPALLRLRPGTMPRSTDPRWDQDGLHEYLRGFRRVLDSYPGDRMAVGEAWVDDDTRLARYVRPDELNLTFNFRLVQADWGAATFGDAIARSLHAMSEVGAPCTWVLANHDVVRARSRYGGGAVGLARARAAALMQLSLPGAAYIYNGDELGLPNVELPDEALRDPAWERGGHTDRGRDGQRVPLPWSGSAAPYGFTAGATTWLPMPDDWAELTVAHQQGDADSTLQLYRSAIQLRHSAGIERADFAWAPAPDQCLAYRRGEITVLLNAGQVAVPLPPGELLLASTPLHDGKLPADAAAWVRT